jgi:mono/diheme cytochrome c family protein
MMRSMIVAATTLVAALGWYSIGNAMAQSASSTWGGVYTEAQAARGSSQYLQHCSVCHAANLTGNYETPPLVGQFMPNWAGSTVDDLFDYISTAMPLNHPGSLNSEGYADIVAFLLKANGFPPGQTELQSGDKLKSIAIDIVKPSAPEASRPSVKHKPSR